MCVILPKTPIKIPVPVLTGAGGCIPTYICTGDDTTLQNQSTCDAILRFLHTCFLESGLVR